MKNDKPEVIENSDTRIEDNSGAPINSGDATDNPEVPTKLPLSRCEFIGEKGRCRGMAVYSDNRCLTHTDTVDPEMRKAWRKKGGVNRKKGIHVADVKLENLNDLRYVLEYATTELLNKRLHPQSANAIVNICNCVSKVLEMDLTDDINDLKKQIKKNIANKRQ